ncbi:transposase [Streptomyces sp. CG4]|uniref:transposase n=1 Tax=Streptomyces sp. CG4 TaxID=408783 RepID=UPI0034E28C0D
MRSRRGRLPGFDYGDAAAVRLGLEERGLTYVVGIATTTTAQPEAARPHIPPYGGRGPGPGPLTPSRPRRRSSWSSRPASGPRSRCSGGKAPGPIGELSIDDPVLLVVTLSLIDSHAPHLKPRALHHTGSAFCTVRLTGVDLQCAGAVRCLCAPLGPVKSLQMNIIGHLERGRLGGRML